MIDFQSLRQLIENQRFSANWNPISCTIKSLGAHGRCHFFGLLSTIKPNFAALGQTGAVRFYNI